MKKQHIVKQNDRHLKWRSFDLIEYILMVFCGLCLAGFTATVFLDVVTRTLRHPWLWLQEMTLGFFVWGVFLGGAAAVRRSEHFCLSVFTQSMKGKIRLVAETFNRLVIFSVALALVYFGYINFLSGFGSYMMPSMVPIAVLYAAIPVSGILITLFVIEQLINGLRCKFQPIITEEALQHPQSLDLTPGLKGVTYNE